MRFFILILAWLLVAFSASSATLWYVDSDATGADDGTSWTDAWPELTDIVWGSINPTDIIYLSGGTYTGVVSLGASGTNGGPITLKKSQEVGHTDLATLNGRISSAAQWFTVDGADDDSYTNSVTYTYSVLNVTNNCGIKIDSTSESNHAFNVFGTGPNGMVVKWVELTTGTNIVGSPLSCFRLNGGDITNSEIAYCWMHHTVADGVSMAQDNHWVKDSILVHHNLVEDIGDDGIVHNGGATIYNNIVRDTLQLYGHPDGIVGLAFNTYIYNNIIYDWNTEPLYPGINRVAYSNFFLYGNVVYSEDYPDTQEAGALITVEASFPWKVGSVYTTNAYWENVVIANNSFIAGRWLLDPLNIPNRYSPDNRPGEPGLVITNLGWIVKNNIFYGGKSLAADFKGWDGSGWYYEDADMVVENNSFYSTLTDGNRIRYKSATFYDDVVAFEAATSATGNTSNAPTFLDFEGRDFRLADGDIGAIGLGQNLSALNLPGLDTDVWGNARGDGVWDIGAIAYTLTNDLLLHLTFEDDFVGNGFAADSSGNAAHMLQYGWAGDTTTNYPTIALGKIGDQSASFLPYYDSHPYTDTNFNDGQYGAITNLGGLLLMTQATFAAWVKFADTGTDTDTRNHNATILDGGYSVSNTWHWGRYYSTTYGEPQFLIRTNSGGGGAASYRAKWYNGGVEDFWYTNNWWWHLAVSVDCSTPTNLAIITYTNGIVVSNLTLSLAQSNAVYYLTANDAPGVDWGEWIGVGCWTHNGTPPLEAGSVPNNGWLNGDLDDIRVYNRVLSTLEIQNIVDITLPGAVPWNVSSANRMRGAIRR